LKIMAVITQMTSGGAERVMATLCNELAKRNEVRLIILKTGKMDYPVSERVTVRTGNIRHQNMAASVRFLKREMKAWPADVILSFMTKTNIITLLAADREMRKRTVIAERADPHNTKPIFRAMRRVLYPRAGGATFQTEDARDYYRGIIRGKTAVLKNPLSPDFQVSPWQGERSRRIVNAQRLSGTKNHALLIRAFERIAEDFPDYALEIYGEGPEKENLEKQVAASRYRSRIRLMGRMDRIQDRIRDAGLFVLPSDCEGMPNALIEAMALGIPSIATDCPIGGCRVVVRDHENGLLVPVGDEERMAAAMREILGDRALAEKLSENGTKIAEECSAETVCREWEGFLKSIWERQ